MVPWPCPFEPVAPHDIMEEVWEEEEDMFTTSQPENKQRQRERGKELGSQEPRQGDIPVTSLPPIGPFS